MANKTDYSQDVKKGRRPYWLAVLIAADQLVNVVLWGFPDETISSRAYRGAVLDPRPKRRWVVAHAVINTIFFWDTEGRKKHCQLAYEGELIQVDFPKVKRNGH